MFALSRRVTKSWRLALVVLISIGVVVVAWRQFRGNDTARDSALASIERAVELFAGVPTRPFTGFAPDDLVRLVSATSVDGEPLDDSRHAKLNTLVCEFLQWRFLQGSPSEYRRWRLGRGYTMQPAKAFVDDWKLGDYYQRVVERPTPGDATIEALFDELWPAEVRTPGGIYTPRGMGVDASGMAIAFGTMSSHQPRVRPRVRGVQGDSAWYAGSIGTHRNWFEPGFPEISFVDDPITYEVAEVGFVLSFESGGQRPLTLILFWDASRNDWIIGGLCVSAMRHQEPVALIEY